MAKKKSTNVHRESVAGESADIAAERTDALRQLFPDAFSEGKVDVEKLRAALGDLADDRPERYSFSWAGKRDAIRLLQTPSRATLVPCPDESVNWDTTQHLFVEGDNLEVLKLLYRSYAGRVKMIYIDPPYNTGNDFIYPDDFSDPLGKYLELTAQKDANGNLLTSNPETSGRYHSAWLSMMYPRLFIARQLLRDDGVIFVSIDDHEVGNLRLLFNEVFGEENFVATLIWQKMDSPSRNDSTRATSDFHDYILVYARNKNSVRLRQKQKPEILDAYPITLPDGRLARRRQLRKNGKNARREDRPTMWFPLTAPDGTEVWPIAPEGWEGRWVLSKETWLEREAEGRTEWIQRESGWIPYYIEVAPNEPSVPWPTIWTDVDQNRQAKARFTALLGSGIEFDNPKPPNLIANILRMATEADDIVLDFFSGSSTTAEAALQLNGDGHRRFIMVQLPEPSKSTQYPTVAEIGKERIRRVIKELQVRHDEALNLDDASPEPDLGFRVFKLAESNNRRWRGTEQQDAGELSRQMALFNDPLVPGWQPLSVMYEVILKEGYSLTSRIEEVSKKDAANTVHRVTDDGRGQSFLICLDDHIDPKTSRALELGRDDVFICRDVALDDELAANLALQCRLKTI